MVEREDALIIINGLKSSLSSLSSDLRNSDEDVSQEWHSVETRYYSLKLVMQDILEKEGDWSKHKWEDGTVGFKI